MPDWEKKQWLIITTMHTGVASLRLRTLALTAKPASWLPIRK
ncbi:hypothetical protein [Klebsiella phage vB_KpnS-MUC-5.2]|nr:hypothetical protein [Klebsiella phage vB_KpnS-MUC-5.2]